MAVKTTLTFKFKALVDKHDGRSLYVPEGEVEQCERFLHVQLNGKKNPIGVSWTVDGKAPTGELADKEEMTMVGDHWVFLSRFEAHAFSKVCLFCGCRGRPWLTSLQELFLCPTYKSYDKECDDARSWTVERNLLKSEQNSAAHTYNIGEYALNVCLTKV